MIHLQANTASQEIHLTLYEAKKDFDTFSEYLIRFVNMASRTEYVIIADVAVDVERYTKINIGTNVDNAVNGSILIEETGMFEYYAYGQNSTTNLDHEDASVVGMIERGVLMIDGVFTNTEYSNDDNDVMYGG